MKLTNEICISFLIGSGWLYNHDKEITISERNNAIDDFAERLATYLGVENATKYGNKNAEQQINSYDTLMKYEIADAIEDVAEQLKVGGTSGTDNQ